MKPSKIFFPLCLSLALVCSAAQAQLFDNLAIHSSRIRVGDPNIRSTVSPEGPKGLVTADFDGDGNADVATSNADGSVDVLYGVGDGSFGERVLLTGDARTLRGIVAADLNGDDQSDIATADPFDQGQLLIYFSQAGGRSFDTAVVIPTWSGARNLVADDFDGDGDFDLVVAGGSVGVWQLDNDGAGGFTFVAEAISFNGENFNGAGAYSFKPVFTLRTFKPAGSSLPKLALTHADTQKLWILSAPVGGSGLLEIETALFLDADRSDFLKLHDFEIAPLSEPLSSSVPDLVTVSKVSNTVTVWRGLAEAPYFSEEPYQQFLIPGGPRSVKVADTNHDGWGELAIVVRNFDHALVYKNRLGLLEPMVTLPSPRSPREVVMPDLNGDGCADVAIINRKSSDVKIHVTDVTSPDGFAVPRQLYVTNGDPAGLGISDLDGDGRGEVIQLHRTPGDISVRAVNADGSLADPVFYPMGINSNGMTLADLNGDGVDDVSVANLGRGNGGGNLAIRYGDGVGGFGPRTTIEPPATTGPTNAGNLGGGMFALVQADFDGDGIEDQAIGYYDCRVTFFQGTADGGFEPQVTTEFVYESRVMVVGDFDQDGDIDIAGAGATGDGVTLINNGDFFTNEKPERAEFKFDARGSSAVRSVVVNDVNDDGDLDLVLATGTGVQFLLGSVGGDFVPTGGIGSGAATSAVVQGDFDNDSIPDLAVACASNSRLQIHAATAGDIFEQVLDIDVPSAAYIAAGDIDGDGLVDLAGTGTVLWTALSGGSPAPKGLSGTSRETLTGVLINEVFPKNDDVPIAEADGRTSDAVEVINATPRPIDLDGWTLRLKKVDGETVEHKVVGSNMVAPGEQAVFVCREGDSELHTGYKLQAEGGQLTLLDPDGSVSDDLVYPEMDADISLARYGDANASFYFNSFPDIGRANLDNGLNNPDLKFLGVTPGSMDAGEPVRFTVEARDDVGMVLVGVSWQRLDAQGSGWIPLYDDGLHDDGEGLDGIFAGEKSDGFPDGAEVEFFITGFDLSDEQKTIPDSALFSVPGMPLRNFSFAVGSARDLGNGIEVSEIVASNDGSIVDEAGEASDWIELRNVGREPVSLDDFVLGQSTASSPDEVLRFPAGTVIASGEYLIVWADDDLDQGDMHAPFKLTTSGESVALLGETELGAIAVVSELTWPELETGEAFAILGGSLTRIQQPTPGGHNLLAGEMEVLPTQESADLRFLYSTGNGESSTWILERSESLNGATFWEEVERWESGGVERLFEQPRSQSARMFFRVRNQQ